MRRIYSYPLSGMLLGLAAPLAALLLHWVLGGRGTPFGPWLTHEFEASGFFYAFSAAGTAFCFGFAGLWAGRTYDRLDGLTRELQELSLRDPLTTLHNHRSVLEELNRSMAQAIRRESPISCLMIDVDFFKDINDEHGHLVGDEVLREVAARLARLSREGDVVGRFGGDEFLVVLPDADIQEARRIGDRLRAEIEAEPFRIADLSIPVRVSIGAAQRTPGQIRPEQLITAADYALYAAKFDGRNRVMLAPVA